MDEKYNRRFCKKKDIDKEERWILCGFGGLC